MAVIFYHEQVNNTNIFTTNKWDYSFYGHLAFSNQVHDFFLWSHSDCHKSQQVSYHYVEVAIKKK